MTSAEEYHSPGYTVKNVRQDVPDKAIRDVSRTKVGVVHFWRANSEKRDIESIGRADV